MFLNFLILFFATLFLFCVFDIVTHLVIAINFGVDCRPSAKQLSNARKDALSIIVGGVMAYCLVIIVMVL